MKQPWKKSSDLYELKIVSLQKITTAPEPLRSLFKGHNQFIAEFNCLKKMM